MKNLTTEQIFGKVNAHMTQALMFHNHMNDYFNFLNLWGFKELHQYQYFDESIGKIKFHNTYINQFNELLDDGDVKGLNIIPLEWYGNNRSEIDNTNMPKYVKQGWEDYVEWEESTKKLYQDVCIELHNRGELTKYNLMMEYLKDVQQELVEIYRIKEELNNCGYDPTYILDMQEKLYNDYYNRMKSLKI